MVYASMYVALFVASFTLLVGPVPHKRSNAIIDDVKTFQVQIIKILLILTENMRANRSLVM